MDADNAATAPHVIIVSHATARKFWGDADPMGHTLRRSADRGTPFTVIGVVGDVRDTALNQESPALYYPIAARATPLMDVVVRTNSKLEAMLPAIRRKVHELDGELALANVRTMDDWVSNSAAQPRLNTVLLAGFAAMALLIASIGIYGVLAYSVGQRTREIGVRMVLGASPRAVLGLIVGEGMKVAAAGIGSHGLLARAGTGPGHVEPRLWRARPRSGDLHGSRSGTRGCCACSLHDSRTARCASQPNSCVASRVMGLRSNRDREEIAAALERTHPALHSTLKPGSRRTLIQSCSIGEEGL